MNIQSIRQTVRSSLPLLLIAGVLAVTAYRLRFAPVPVRALPIGGASLTNETIGTGTLEARVRAAISSKIAGRIAGVHADQNDFVQAGQLLVTIDDGELQELVEVAAASLGAAEASVARAKADRERLVAIQTQARLDHQRIEDLLASKIASQADLDKAVERLSIAEADLKRSDFVTAEAERHAIAAQRNLLYQRERLKDARILSPFNGLVVKRNREPGDVVVPGSSVLDLVSTNELWISAWVDETALSHLWTGAWARVIFRSDPKRPSLGEVARIGREADRETRELLVDVRVKELPEHWAVGQRAEVFIQGRVNSSSLSVPSEAIQWRQGRPGLFVRSGSRAAWRDVQIGARAQGRTEILSGVAAEDEVLLEGKAGSLRDGRRIGLP
jgi:HlyD family secretion protein